MLAVCGSSMLLSLRMYTAQGQACALGMSLLALPLQVCWVRVRRAHVLQLMASLY
jgi:hypothetical protein